MAEIKTQVEQAASSLEKVIAEQTARIETAVADMARLQTKGIAEASAFFEDATRIVREQVAFAEQLGGEWRKLVLASAKSATELFSHKA
jgi:hypothetical protein